LNGTHLDRILSIGSLVYYACTRKTVGAADSEMNPGQ